VTCAQGPQSALSRSSRTISEESEKRRPAARNLSLGGLDLSGLEVRGGASSFRVELPKPSGTVPVRISGGASEIVVRRPAGVAARVRLKGWASQLTFDDQTFGAIGSDVSLQSPGYEDAAARYDVEVSGSVSDVTLTTAG